MAIARIATRARAPKNSLTPMLWMAPSGLNPEQTIDIISISYSWEGNASGNGTLAVGLAFDEPAPTGNRTTVNVTGFFDPTVVHKVTAWEWNGSGNGLTIPAPTIDPDLVTFFNRGNNIIPLSPALNAALPIEQGVSITWYMANPPSGGRATIRVHGQIL